ncbi:DUF6481 family protein [Rhizobiaceae bacterium]|nr:DUF6481 family protein [Rhizobiaceae bacterium]
MKKVDGAGLEDRRQAALDAKKAMLERFRAKPSPDDPKVIAKREERARIAEAREERRKEREKQAELDRIEEERLAEVARQEEIAAEEARQKAARDEADRLVAEEAEAKAERDRKYAARRDRKSKGKGKNRKGIINPFENI